MVLHFLMLYQFNSYYTVQETSFEDGYQWFYEGSYHAFLPLVQSSCVAVAAFINVSFLIEKC
jgi:hypothetical protein